MNISRAVRLLFCLTFFCMGCRQEPSAAVTTAMENQVLATRLASDQVTILFAQQEAALAKRQADTRPAATLPGSMSPEGQAQLHMEAAELQLKIDEDRAQVQEDIRKWKAFAANAKSSQSH